MKIADIDTDFQYFQQYQRAGYNVLAVLENAETGEKRLIPGRNIVTTKGNKWYAQRGANSVSGFAITGLKLGIGSTAVSAGDLDIQTSFVSCFKIIDATYPTYSDADTDNTGRGSNIVTWRVTYNASDVSQIGIRELALVDASNTTNNINHALFAVAFDKTYSDTLKVFINHTFSGV